MKFIQMAFIALIATLVIQSCEKDEGNLPQISFKTGGSYISKDDSLAIKTGFIIGINAAKSEKKDVLKKFNISKSIDGGASVSVLNKDLSSSEEDNFSFDYNDSMGSVVGQKTKYIFTITNRDGLTNTVSVTLKGK